MAGLWHYDRILTITLHEGSLLHDDTHTMSADSEYCHSCGQRLPAREGYGYGRRKRLSDRIGIAISVGLHLLAVLYYFLKPSEPFHRTPPQGGGEMVYIAPLPNKPNKPNKPEKKTELAKAKPQPQPKRAVATITPPAARPKLETYVPPVVAPMKPPPEMDMSEMIAKRRAQREAEHPQPVEPAPESENDRAMRIAKANIAGAQGRSSGRDRDDTGGLFSIADRTYHGAEVKFRGWNTNFRRNWTQQVHVEVGDWPDLETAIVKKMIEIIRKDHPGDFPWESQRLGKVIVMSARKQDEPELTAFLLKEMFPEYRRGR